MSRPTGLARLALVVATWGLAGCAGGPQATPAVTAAMTGAEVDAAMTSAQVLSSECWMGDAAVIVDQHTLMLIVYGTTDRPVRGVTATESAGGHLTVHVDGAAGSCEDAQRSHWRVTSEADLVADGDPEPVTVLEDGRSTDVPVGGARLERR